MFLSMTKNFSMLVNSTPSARAGDRERSLEMGKVLYKNDAISYGYIFSNNFSKNS